MPRELTDEQKERKNYRNKMLRLFKKVEQGYVPTDEEQKMLIAEGFLGENTEIVEDKEMSQIQDEEGQGIEGEYNEAVLMGGEPTEYVVDPEIEEYMKGAESPEQEEQVEEPVSVKETGVVKVKVERPAIVQDNEITEITGHLLKLEVDDDVANGEVLVKDVDGNEHELFVSGKQKIWSILYRTAPKRYIDGMSAFTEMSDAEREEEINYLIGLEKPLVFRVEDDQIFATVSVNYQARKIEDVIPLIKDMLPDVEMEIEPSTGKHGGYAVIQTGGNDIAKYNVKVDGNILDGMHSITLTGRGEILFCSNQLIMEVQKMVANKVPKFAFGVRQAHQGDEEQFKEKLNGLLNDIKAFMEVLENAKNVEVKPEMAEKIYDFYRAKGMISEKTKVELMEAYPDLEVQQVENTLWGVAMVATYVGTHHEKLRDGVKGTLAKIGGELLIVSEVWDEYKQMIEDEWVKSEEERRIKAEEKAKKEAEKAEKKALELEAEAAKLKAKVAQEIAEDAEFMEAE